MIDLSNQNHLDAKFNEFIDLNVKKCKAIEKDLEKQSNTFLSTIGNEFKSYFEVLKKYPPNPSLQEELKELNDRVEILKKSFSTIIEKLPNQFLSSIKSACAKDENNPSVWYTEFKNVINPLLAENIKEISSKFKELPPKLNKYIAANLISGADNQKVTKIIGNIIESHRVIKKQHEKYVKLIDREPKKSNPSSITQEGGPGAQPIDTTTNAKRVRRNPKVTFSNTVGELRFYCAQNLNELDRNLAQQTPINTNKDSRSNNKSFSMHDSDKQNYQFIMEGLSRLPNVPVRTDRIIIRPNVGLKSILVTKSNDSSAASSNPALAGSKAI
jgi:hypothetical protein